MFKKILLLLSPLLIACNSPKEQEKASVVYTGIEGIADLYTVSNAEKLLLLFPCYPCDAANTLQEFDPVEQASRHKTSVLLMNYNFKLYLNTSEKKQLSKLVEDIISSYQLPNKVVVGGFSSGGNISLLMGNYWSKSSAIDVQGVFAVDPPLDLERLYQNSLEVLYNKAVSPESVQEANHLVKLFDRSGDFRNLSPVLLSSGSLKNIEGLKEVPLRLYTEVDSSWWKESRALSYRYTNTHALQEIDKQLREQDFDAARLIISKKKGYRSDGSRHPHSWSIVDKEDLFEWIDEY
jgi:hypothetical protein